jgi:hypothetical protein
MGFFFLVICVRFADQQTVYYPNFRLVIVGDGGGIFFLWELLMHK